MACNFGKRASKIRMPQLELRRGTTMALGVEQVSPEEAEKVIRIEEGQFADVKATEIAPAKLTKTISAFANSDGGELHVGIGENKATKERFWKGFPDQEAANGHLQIFEKLFP